MNKESKELEDKMNEEVKEPKYFNPLAKGSQRNKYCPCRSGKKVKKCCGENNIIDKHEWNRLKTMMGA